MPSSKKHEWINTAIALLSLGVAIGIPIVMGTLNFLGSLGVGASSTAASQTSVCLNWATFVRTQQESRSWGGTPTSAIDRRIDRMGEVLYTRLEAEFETWLAFPSASATPTASPTAPPPTPAAATLPLRGLAEYCGSAREFRQARDTDDPLLIPRSSPSRANP